MTDSNATDGIDVTGTLTLDGGTQINSIDSGDGRGRRQRRCHADGVVVDGDDLGCTDRSIVSDSGALKIGATGAVDVTGAATLDGVVVTDSNAGDGIDVTTSGAVLTLDGGTQINSIDSGALKIGHRPRARSTSPALTPRLMASS